MSLSHPPRHRGLYPVVPTIFNDDGSLDLDGQRRCVQFMIDSGVDGLCVLANYSEQFLLADEEREILTRQILQCVDGRVPVIVTTSHFSSTVCVERSRRPGHGRRHGDGHAALSWRDVPGRRSADPRFLRDPVRCAAHSHHDPGCARGGTPMSPAFLARMAREIEQVSYFKMETAGAAAKLRELIQLGGEAIEGPWDGEEGITLLADLDAGATGSMTGGGYADGIRPSSTPIGRGPGPGLCAVPGLASLINHENRQAGFLAAKALMKEGGIIRCDAPRHPWPALHPETRRGLLDIARRLDPLVLRWA